MAATRRGMTRGLSKSNDLETDYDILVTSMQLLAFVFNFHKACYKDVIIENAANTPTTLQNIRRLWRIGRSHDVNFKILQSQGTYDTC